MRLFRSAAGFLWSNICPGVSVRWFHVGGGLRSDLSRSMTQMYLLTSHGNLEDNIRMMTNTGVKFAGRTVYQWGREEAGESALPAKLERAKQNAAQVHAADPEIILQACIFEIISRDVDKLALPVWAFEDLVRAVEKRNFRHDDIINADGRFVDRWRSSVSVPGVSQDET